MNALTPTDTERLERLRAICLALPEATEKLAWSTPTFRIGGKIFAQYEAYHHGSDRVGVWLNAAPGTQEALVENAPERFFRPAYVGHKGWIGVFLDVDVDWEELAVLVAESYRLTAPKRFLRLLDTASP